MKQNSRAQVPGVDLTFDDGRTGRIWGTSSTDDTRGASFDKARLYLEQRAAQDGVIEWKIIFDLELVGSTSFKALIDLLVGMDKLVKADPEKRSIEVEWRVRRGNNSLRTVAEDMKEMLVKQGEPCLQIYIISDDSMRIPPR
jgi:hypothetical protein